MTPLYSRLYPQARTFRPLRVLPVNSFQQHGQLRRRQVDFSVAGQRPHEAPALQAFGEQAQAVAVSPQHLYHVAAAAPEDKQVTAERVSTKRILYL